MQRNLHQRSKAAFAAACLALAVEGPAAFGHSVRQKLGGYADSDGTTRQRIGLDAAIEPAAGETLTASSYTLSILRDAYQASDAATNEYDREVYGSGYRLNRTATVATNQTWNRVTETRVLGSYATDDRVRSRTWSAGASQWFRHETLRVGIDLSRTVVEQPLYQILDFDSREIGNPTVLSSVGASLGVRHLATPTLILDYAVTRLEAENRPPAHVASIGARRFVPALDGAAHAILTRGDNRGRVDETSTYGEVDAWQAEAAWVQNLWKGGLARLGYRYYQEDETTRAYRDRKVFGSDTVTLGLSQELRPSKDGTLPVPVTLDAAAGRYLTNAGISARSFEAGLTARF